MKKHHTKFSADLELPTEILSQHVAILGKTRSGKSSAMRVLVEDLLERDQPVCIVDPKGDWWGIKLAADGRGPGYPVVIFGGEHADIPINEHAGAHVAELFATGNRPCLIDLGGWMPGPRTRFWIDFASTLFKQSRGDRWLVVDEVHNFAPKGKTLDVDAGKALHWTNRLASEGLGKGLAMVFASQRPQKVHNDTLTSAETLIAMRVIHPSDRGAVSDWIKGCGDSDGSEVLNSLAQMARGEGWVWSPEIGYGPARVQFPLFTTYDSFRPQTVDDTKKLKGWAEVDLDEVRETFAAVVEQAKADDPKELRKRIAELEKQLRGRSQTAAAAPTDRDVQRVRAEVTREVRAQFEPLVKERDAALRDMQSRFTRVDRLFRKAFADLEPLAQEFGAAMPNLSPMRVAESAPPPAREVRQVHARPSSPRPAGNRTDSSVTAPQQRILDALAWLESMHLPSPAKNIVAWLADASPTSSGFANNLGALRTAGLIDYPRPGVVALTDAGRAIAQAPPAPLSPEELHDAVFAKVTTPQRKILEALIRKYPHALDRDALADAAEASATSSGYANNLGALRSLGLIDYPERGKVVAQPVLFLEERRL